MGEASSGKGRTKDVLHLDLGPTQCFDVCLLSAISGTRSEPPLPLSPPLSPPKPGLGQEGGGGQDVLDLPCGGWWWCLGEP